MRGVFSTKVSNDGAGLRTIAFESKENGDVDQAVTAFYITASCQKDPTAMFMIGQYWSGQWGDLKSDERNLQRAIKWYGMAANLGCGFSKQALDKINHKLSRSQ